MAESSEKGPSGKTTTTEPSAASNFIRDLVQQDLASNKYQGRVVTRFPPEPNGYLHIGHAKSICLNFGLALDFNGACHLRFDDTNPTTEDLEYVESIQNDVRWLGFDWKDKLFYASDYYQKLYDFAVELIRRGKAYVCSMSEEDVRKSRGSISEPGTLSPFASRTVDENLDLLERMRKGEFPDSSHVVRARIDMASANMKMRDPLIYRIRHAEHYRTGKAWCIYPLYDFAHCLSDWLEGITHSICTLEFENNRELYDWFLIALDLPNRPEQTEFARLNLTYTMMSKRKLLQLVEEKLVHGWDDPRMPTIAGLRRRGVTPEALRAFCERIGVSKNNSIVEVALFEHVLREDLNLRAPRVMAVLRPLKVTVETWPEGHVETTDAPYWPADVGKEGSRPVPMSRILYIDREDFQEDPPKDYFRLAPGKEVRLRHGYIIRCERVIKDPATGEVTEVVCSHDPTSRGEGEGAGRKVKGTLHWVSAAHSATAEVRLYDRLFTVEQPGISGAELAAELNPLSLVTVQAQVEPSLTAAKPGDLFQFERTGFFNVDLDSRTGALVFNRTVHLKDSWTKTVKAPAPEKTEKPLAATTPAANAPKAARPAKADAELSPEAARLQSTHGIPAEDARILAGDAAVTAFFEQAIAAHPSPKTLAKWIVNDVIRAAKGGSVASLPIDGRALGELVAILDGGTITGKIAKDVLEQMLAGKGRAAEIIAAQGLTPIADTGTLDPVVDAILAENADAVARYRAGNLNLLGAFVGMVMKKTGGKANPKLLNDLLKKKLDG
jgi:glutaminyl-tRNA synthetase